MLSENSLLVVTLQGAMIAGKLVYFLLLLFKLAGHICFSSAK